MANCLLCYPNHVDSATLSGGSWTSTLPLTNLQTRFPRQYARTTDAFASSSIINVDFGDSVYSTAIALVNHNISLDGKIRVRLWSDSDMTETVFDSGEQDVWPRWFDTLQLRWGDSNFWGGKISPKLFGTVPAIYLMMLDTAGFAANATAARAATIEISDEGNDDGYIQAGRLFIAEDWTPSHNMVYGASIQWVDPSIVDTALDGTKWFDKRTKYRQQIFQLKYMKYSEGANKALLMTQQLGLTGDMLFVFDPSDQQLMQQRSFVGTLAELSPLEFWMFRLTSMAFKIEELV